MSFFIFKMTVKGEKTVSRTMRSFHWPLKSTGFAGLQVHRAWGELCRDLSQVRLMWDHRLLSRASWAFLGLYFFDFWFFSLKVEN